MSDGTEEDYAILRKYEEEAERDLPKRLLAAVEALEDSLGGLQVSRRVHSLQSATRALNDGRSEEYVVAALLHDIGDVLAPHTHGEMVAAVLKPYISEEICWVVQHHGIFQMYHYAHRIGGDRNARDRYAGHPYFDACAEFCEKYDENCFDPDFTPLPLEHFAPMVERVMSEPRYLDRD
jgi:predicted HD phosphohydrolase